MASGNGSYELGKDEIHDFVELDELPSKIIEQAENLPEFSGYNINNEHSNNFCENNEHSNCHARNTTQEVIVRRIGGRLGLAIRIFKNFSNKTNLPVM